MASEKPTPERSYWESHPLHPIADWQYEVANGDTLESYAAWLQTMLEYDAEDESPQV